MTGGDPLPAAASVRLVCRNSFSFAGLMSQLGAAEVKTG